MAAPLLSLQDVRLGFGGRPLFEGVELTVGLGDRVALVGRNGTGKSTLLKVMADVIQPDRGERQLRRDAKVEYVSQEPSVPPGLIMRDFVAAALPDAQVNETYRADALLDGLGVDPDRSTDGLSGGEARRAVLARAFASAPDILLLDEPTNHLDLAAIEWLEKALAGFRGGLVLISHDRRFLSTLTRVTFWLERGVIRRLEKGFGAFEAWADEQLELEARERHRLDKLIAQETQWLHKGVTARRKRNMGRLRRLRGLQKERANQVAFTGKARMDLQAGQASGKLVVQVEGIGKSYGDRTLFSDFSTTVLRGDRVGIIGPNGAGKSTMIKILLGEIEPDAGKVKLGTNLTQVYLDQHRASLDDSLSVWDTLCPDGGDRIEVQGQSKHVVGYLRDFLFDSRQARTPVSSLSGGERNRLLLARALARPSNFLVLDEPTNDLDIETLDLLQELLADYDGTLLLVSHDRDFLDRVVTSTIVLEGDGTVVEYAGGYSDYLTQRTEREVAQATKSQRSDRGGKGRKLKLSYKQTQRLEALPGEMAALNKTIAEGEAQLEDPDFYGRDPDGFSATLTRLQGVRDRLARAEDEWLELEMLQEEINAG